MLTAFILIALYWIAGKIVKSRQRHRKQLEALRAETEFIRSCSAALHDRATQADTKPEYARTQDTTSKPERPTTNYRRQHRDSR